jgi:hypothetical protein
MSDINFLVLITTASRRSARLLASVLLPEPTGPERTTKREVTGCAAILPNVRGP